MYQPDSSSGSRKTLYSVNAAKQIMQIAHDVLISAHHKEAEIINFAGMNPM